ncbi:dynein regulatory complex protein 11-like [Battus philenor]|uniref:dynein regulatory complex protein 11-like n=1 Tax=Battus philenor TaxID=42288 RepID=UPI0035D01CEB
MSEYYFYKWQQVLAELEMHVKLDLEFQDQKIHDQTSCEAAYRLCSISAKYMALYNDSLDCLQQNLQVQKTEYMQVIVNAITARILELKHQLRKLEGYYHQYFANGLVQHILTFDNTYPRDLPGKIVRSVRMQAIIDDVMQRTREKIELFSCKVAEEETNSLIKKIDLSCWDSDEEDDELVKDESDIDVKISEESLKRMEMIKLIQAHERSRQVIRWKTKRQLKRETWEKELKGTLKPQAGVETRERAAKMIKTIFRRYFEIKRRHIYQDRVDEILGINLSFKPFSVEKQKYEKLKEQINNKQIEYNKECKSHYDESEGKCSKKIKDKIQEDYRDFIRDWLRKWFEEVKFFYDIPKEEKGGTSLIITENVPTPSEWQEQYEAYLEEKKSNKNKSELQKKWEKMESKKEELRLKKEELKKLKQEQELIKKMMNNPTMHPGFNYPASKKTENIVNAIVNYRRDWKDLDTQKTVNVKEGFVREINENNAYMNTKMEIIKMADDDMREELRILKKALQIDYNKNNEKMPEEMNIKERVPKRKRRLKSTISQSIQNKMEDLAFAGFIKETTRMKLEDFYGDFNLVGEDLRCALRPTQPLGGDVRFLWWERCIEAVRGARRILLVGPPSGGKSTLVHVMASINGAILFELDPWNIPKEQLTSTYLNKIVQSVITCSRAIQPSVIHIKCLHILFCKKVPPEGNKNTLDICVKYFVTNLLKKIRKNDLITVIGSCQEPWLTKSAKLLKKFPEVILLPNTTYSTVSLILRNWIINNRIVPRNLTLQCIAHLLQGYPFGYLKQSLDSFLTPDTIIRIAARGLNAEDVIQHVTRDGTLDCVDYNKYLQWYYENTTWGKREAKRLTDDKEFKQLAEKFAEKEKSKRNRRDKATDTSKH